MRLKTDGKLFDALEIRDTDAHNSSSIDNAISGSLLFAAENTLNQAVTVKFQGSFDGTTWHDLPGSASVSATTGVDEWFLSDPWPKVRAVATAGVQPASGSLTVWYAWREAV